VSRLKAKLILVAVPGVEVVEYSLPNKHYFEIGELGMREFGGGEVVLMSIDLSWHKGIQNTGKDAEVYAPQNGPNGLIQCSVTRG